MRIPRQHPILIGALLLLMASTSVYAILCHDDRLFGFFDSQRRGDGFLPNHTHKLKSSSLYIEMTSEGPWYQTDYVAPGYGNPGKIGNDPLWDAKEAFRYLSASRSWNDKYLGTAEQFATPQNTVPKKIGRTGRRFKPFVSHFDLSELAYQNDVHVFVDKNVFNHDGTSQVNLGHAKKISVVDGETSEVLGEVERLSRPDGPPLYMARASGCCFYGIPPYQARNLIINLRKLPFRKKDVALVSLVRDSATESTLANSKTLSQVTSAFKGKVIDNEASMKAAVASHAGKTLVILGHVEQGQFVVKTALGEVQFTAELKELHELAKQHQTKLLLLGCESAKQVDALQIGVGAINRFNSVKVAHALSKAIAESKNYAEFFESLASPGLKLVANPGFVSLSKSYHPYPKVTIYTKFKQYGTSVAVATLSMLGMDWELPRMTTLRYPAMTEHKQKIQKEIKSLWLENSSFPGLQITEPDDLGDHPALKFNPEP